MAGISSDESCDCVHGCWYVFVSLINDIPTHRHLPEDHSALTQLFTISALRTDSSGKGLLSLGIQRFARPLGATTVALAVVLLALGTLSNVSPRPSFHVKFLMEFVSFECRVVPILPYPESSDTRSISSCSEDDGLYCYSIIDSSNSGIWRSFGI